MKILSKFGFTSPIVFLMRIKDYYYIQATGLFKMIHSVSNAYTFLFFRFKTIYYT